MALHSCQIHLKVLMSKSTSSLSSKSLPPNPTIALSSAWPKKLASGKQSEKQTECRVSWASFLACLMKRVPNNPLLSPCAHKDAGWDRLTWNLSRQWRDPTWCERGFSEVLLEQTSQTEALAKELPPSEPRS